MLDYAKEKQNKQADPGGGERWSYMSGKNNISITQEKKTTNQDMTDAACEIVQFGGFFGTEEFSVHHGTWSVGVDGKGTQGPMST